jgi:hypothetical protein
MTKTLRLLLAFTVLAVAALASGCGSTAGGGSGSDTAKLAPAASFLYAEANLDPSGEQEAGMRSILADLPGSGPPEQRLDDLLEKASQSEKESKVDYREDVKPWLGDKAAVFMASPKAGAGDPPWAIVIATTDEDKAKETIQKGKSAGDKQRSYNGADYVVDAEGDDAMGVVDGFFVAGSEAGLKAAVDADENGSLAASDRYKEATKDAADERVALVYEDLRGLLQAVAGASGESLGPAAPFIGRIFGGKPVVATIKAEQQALVIDGSLIPSSAGLNLFGKSTSLLGDVPSDSWLAVGQSDFGAVVKTLIGSFAGLVGGEAQLEQQLLAATGLDLDRDLLSWIGDVAFFVNGDSKESVGGGALIQSKDPAASKRALTKLSALAARSGDATVSAASFGDADGYKLQMESAPRGVFMLQAGDKVAITYGEDAAKSALGGSGGGLTSAAGFNDAAGKLGDEYAPALYVTVPPILNVAESFGASGPDYDEAKPYLTILDYVISGGAKSGDEAASRTRIGFKPHE